MQIFEVFFSYKQRPDGFCVQIATRININYKRFPLPFKIHCLVAVFICNIQHDSFHDGRVSYSEVNTKSHFK